MNNDIWGAVLWGFCIPLAVLLSIVLVIVHLP